MVKWSSNHIVLIAAFFVSAFVGVLTTNALCDLGLIEYAPNLAHNHSAEPGHSKTEHQDTHGHRHHQDGSTSEDPCCNDLASQLNSSLFTKIIKHQVIGAKYFLIGNISTSSKLRLEFQSNYIIYHEYDVPPPLGGFSIRVLIQSFLT